MSPCCAAAQAYGMLENGHAFSPARVSLLTESEAVARLYCRMTAAVCGITPPAVTVQGGGFAVSAAAADCAAVLRRFGHGTGELALRLNRANLECDECLSAYLRGAFLACGTVANPENGYHMEWSIPHYNLSRDILALMGELGLGVRYICRKGTHLLYLKESERIEDCLTLMGAVNMSLSLMNVKLVKDIRNKANRIANCENANIDKTVAASAIQTRAVKKIAASGGIDTLPEELRELARLRLENPELSLNELREMLSEPLSRSGVNHRLRRIIKIAE